MDDIDRCHRQASMDERSANGHYKRITVAPEVVITGPGTASIEMVYRTPDGSTVTITISIINHKPNPNGQPAYNGDISKFDIKVVGGAK